jgi:NCAIR mutase (PurE)-related protein
MDVEERGREGQLPTHVLKGVVTHQSEALDCLARVGRVAELGALHISYSAVESLHPVSGVTEGGDDVALGPLSPKKGVLAVQPPHPQGESERERQGDQRDERDHTQRDEKLAKSEFWHVGSSYTRAMRRQEIRELLDQMRTGATTVDQALARLRRLPSHDMGFARPDTHRELRQGLPEAIYAAGKTPQQTVAIARRLIEHSEGPVLATHASAEVAEALLEAFPTAVYSERARLVIVGSPQTDGAKGAKVGKVVVMCAGTSDLPVAEEAALTAEAYGAEVERITDVGVAGLHRLLDVQEQLHQADVVIVIAGMEGALASLVGGITSAPVVAVPTSVGYGASFEGLAALLAMLNSCAAGIAVFNVDNGFGAATFAVRMLRQRR